MTAMTTWVNPMHGTEAGRKALLGAAREVEQSAFRAAKPKLRKPRKVWNVTPEQRYGNGTSTVGKRYTGDDVAKGVLTQGTKPVLARKAPMAATMALKKAPKPMAPKAIIGKAGIGELFHAGRAAFGAGRAGVKASAALPSSRAGRVPKKLIGASHMAGRGFQGAAERPLATGVVAGSVGGGGLVAMRNHRSEQNVNLYKAYGDPEDARYARTGAYAAGLGLAGAGGVGYAVRDSRRATPLARRGATMSANNVRNKKKVTITEGRGKNKVEREVMMLPEELKRYARRFKGGGLSITRRGALVGAGGLAALGGAETMRRKTNERRWD